MPPYFLITLATVQMVSLLLRIWVATVPTWLDAARLVALLVVLSIGVSYPIDGVAPSPNTARVGEVRKPLQRGFRLLADWVTFCF